MIMEKIQVPASFIKDFEDFCRFAKLDPEEREFLKASLRENFETDSKPFSAMVQVYRWCAKSFGGMPTVVLLEEFCRFINVLSFSAAGKGIMLAAKELFDFLPKGEDGLPDDCLWRENRKAHLASAGA